jgi:hypothetical protein
VFTSLASGFMSASSSGPTSPFVRLLNIGCTDRALSCNQLGNRVTFWEHFADYPTLAKAVLAEECPPNYLETFCDLPASRPDVQIQRASATPKLLSAAQQAYCACRLEFSTARKDAKLIALACSEPPKGRARWTSRLLENTVVELNIVDRASDSTIERTLKKTFQAAFETAMGHPAEGQQRVRGGRKTCWPCTRGR